MSWSPLNVFLLAGAMVGSVAGILAIIVARRTGRDRLARQLTQSLLGAGAGYLVLLLGVSLTARETVLPAGEPKWFCGLQLDCHRRARVTGVAAAPTAAGEGGAVQGHHYVVTLQIENSAPVSQRFHQPEARIITDDGRAFPRDTMGERVLGAAALPAEVPPGGIETTVLVFDVPAGAPNPRLLITDHGFSPGRVLESLLIGDEDSFLHPPTTFALDERTRRVGGVRWRIGGQRL